MGRYLYPDQYVDSVWNINYEGLYKSGIRGIILDIDNTLVPYFVKVPSVEVTAGIQQIKQRGFKIFIVSNGKEERVRRFNEGLRLPYTCKAGKPSARGFLKAQTSMGLQPSKIAVIGDQIFTDVWGGNRLSMHTILVKQVSKRDEWITAIKRPLEKVVLLFYKRRERRLRNRLFEAESAQEEEEGVN